MKVFGKFSEFQNVAAVENERVKFDRALKAHAECHNPEYLTLEIVSERVNVLETDRQISDQIDNKCDQHEVFERKIRWEKVAANKPRHEVNKLD